MGRQLDELSPAFRPLADQFLAKLVEAKIPVLIVTTGRTAAEQAEAVRLGRSKVAVSRHQSGNAMDVVLIQGNAPVWNTSAPAWWKLGAIAEALGLRWGGRFGWSALKAEKIGWDPGHVELAR